MKISSNFDGGNITCLDSSNPSDIRLNINIDKDSHFYQWFYFRLTGAQGKDCSLKIENADNAAYLKGWEDYQAVASYDRDYWFRVPTEFDGKTLAIKHQPEFNSIYYAYFAPYSKERHADLMAEAQGSPLVQTSVLGSTLDGQDMDLVQIGETGKNKKTCWVLGRQHPGETMAAWWMEGFLDRMLDEDDPVARELLAKAVFYVVPHMNPDGGSRGHLRTNAAGANLNREWLVASMEKSPEVYVVREKMRATGVDFCLDVHGDEALPYNFIAGPDGVSSWNQDRDRVLQQYKNILSQLSPDFQTQYGYPVDAPGTANLALCTNYVAETFGCLAMTLEMPFKDTVESPNLSEGWSPERCRKLAVANVDAIYAILSQLD